MRTSASHPDRANERPFKTVAAWLIVWGILLMLLNL
jgi:hypothetical protein